MHDLQTMARSDAITNTGHGLSQNTDARQRSDYAVAVDLNQLLIRQVNSAQVLRIRGHGSADLGVLDGDFVVVDRALQAGAHDLIITGHGRDTRVCRQHQLTAEDCPWGVITAIIHPHRPL